MFADEWHFFLQTTRSIIILMDAPVPNGREWDGDRQQQQRKKQKRNNVDVDDDDDGGIIGWFGDELPMRPGKYYIIIPFTHSDQSLPPFWVGFFCHQRSRYGCCCCSFETAIVSFLYFDKSWSANRIICRFMLSSSTTCVEYLNWMYYSQFLLSSRVDSTQPNTHDKKMSFLYVR